MKEVYVNNIVTNTAHAVVWDSTVDKILLVRKYESKFWNLPGGVILRGQLPVQSVAKRIYGNTAKSKLYEFRLMAVLGFEALGGFEFIYHKSTGHEGDVLSIENTYEKQFFTLREIFLETLHVSVDQKRIIGAWQKRLHSADVLEVHSANIKKVAVGTEFVSIQGGA